MKFQKYVPFILVLIAIGAAYFAFHTYKQTAAQRCAPQMKQCPDGTVVTAQGKDCSIPACPPTKVTPPDTTIPTVDPTPTSSFSASCCTREQIRQGDQCLPDCGPPVAQQDAIQTYSCLTKEQVESRKYYGCPICLSGKTMIATPNGDINIQALHAGDMVWTVDAKGKKVAAPLLQTYYAVVPPDHTVFHLILSDNRDLYISPHHPLINGKPIEKLKVGSVYDGAKVTHLDLIHYTQSKTYDILPKGSTGFYWANGILIASTLYQKP